MNTLPLRAGSIIAERLGANGRCCEAFQPHIRATRMSLTGAMLRRPMNAVAIRFVSLHLPISLEYHRRTRTIIVANGCVQRLDEKMEVSVASNQKVERAWLVLKPHAHHLGADICHTSSRIRFNSHDSNVREKAGPCPFSRRGSETVSA